MKLSERVYRRLLVAYPAEHRRRYGDPMTQLFRDRLRQDGGGFSTVLVWGHIGFDLVHSAFTERMETAMNLQTWTSRWWEATVVVLAALMAMGTIYGTDGSPGWALILGSAAVLLIGGLALRSVWRAGATAMVIAGSLLAAIPFWLVFNVVLAVVVIAGLARDRKWYQPESGPQSSQPLALSPQAEWEAAAQALGLELTSSAGFGDETMHGRIDDFLIEVLHMKGSETSDPTKFRGVSRTKFRVVSPAENWIDRGVFRIEPPGGSASEMIYKRLRPTVFTTTGDTEFDKQLVVWAKRRYHPAAQLFLTLNRRQALLRLHRLVPTARFLAWPSITHLTYDTSGVFSEAEITHDVQAMVAAAKDLTDQFSLQL